MAYLYILKSDKGSYYIGSTGDLKARLVKHMDGGVKSTRALRPLTLVYQETFVDRGVAQKKEYEIKRWKNASRIKQFIASSVKS